MNNILDILIKDKERLEEKYKSLGIDAKKVDISDKEWAAIHCAGVLKGYEFYINRIKELN